MAFNEEPSDNETFLDFVEIIPDVTVPFNPRGLPIAITNCPSFISSEFPNLAGVRLSFSTLITAKSEISSTPITLAGTFSSFDKVTVILVLPFIV